MENIIDQLKIKLQDTQHNLQMNITELQSLQTEHDTLLERHNKILQETVAKEAELREKYVNTPCKFHCTDDWCFIFEFCAQADLWS